MDYQHLLTTLATVSQDPWYVISYPGPNIRSYSSGAADLINAVHDCQLNDSIMTVLLQTFACVPRILPSDATVKLGKPLGKFDSLRVEPINLPGEPEAYWVLLCEAVPENPLVQLRRIIGNLSDRQCEILNGIYDGETSRNKSKQVEAWRSDWASARKLWKSIAPGS